MKAEIRNPKSERRPKSEGRSTTLLLLCLLAGCAGPDYTEPDFFQVQAGPYGQARAATVRRALHDDYAVQEKQRLQRDYVNRMRWSRTNYPSYLIPK